MHTLRQATADPQGSAVFSCSLAAATVFAAWLRTHGIDIQIVQDDEWHALHKLMASGYGEILRSFGNADHSIPLTLFYKAMADSIGLTEVDLRAVQMACGVALVALAPLLMLRATRDAPAAALYAFLLAAAPFLVLYSRFARPYAITLLLVVVAVAAAWAWRVRRTLGLAALVASCAALGTWLHPICGLYPAIACAFIFFEDLAGRREGHWARVLGSATLGGAVATAMFLPLAAPLWNDGASLWAKAGGDSPTVETLWRVLSIFSGGLSNGATGAMAALALAGAWQLGRSNPRLAAYLAALGLFPVAIVFAAGAAWSHQGHTFARYVLPTQAIFLAWAALGAVALVRVATRRAMAPWAAAGAFTLAYVLITPTIGQVVSLREWYGHLYYHYDYGDPHNNAIRPYEGFATPDFYRKLGTLPPGSAPIIEAPFTFEAPANVFAFFDSAHGQPVKMGMVHDLCLEGPYVGEVPPRDRRFQFREFVFLDDAPAVRASGARYLLLYRDQLHGRPFVEGERCIGRLAALYGPPAASEPSLVIFDLATAPAQRKLQ